MMKYSGPGPELNQFSVSLEPLFYTVEAVTAGGGIVSEAVIAGNAKEADCGYVPRRPRSNAAQPLPATFSAKHDPVGLPPILHIRVRSDFELNPRGRVIGRFLEPAVAFVDTGIEQPIRGQR